ncbi:MAG: SRPBCC family protein [Polyangiales bacterium]
MLDSLREQWHCAAMKHCRPLTLDAFDRLDDSFRFETTLDATPERVFAVFEDPDSWPVWAGAIRKVTWTSRKPFGVGTSRDVEIVGGLTAHERFFVWEPPHRMAFYFEGTNKPAVSSLAEYYELRALDGGRTRFVWRVAYEPRSFMRYLSAPLRPLVRLMGARIVRGLERYVRELPAIETPAGPSAETTAYG